MSNTESKLISAVLQDKQVHVLLQANVDGILRTHNDIWQFHTELIEQNIPHIFFNGNNDFDIIENPRFNIDCERRDWGTSYIGPYDPNSSFDSIIRAKGIETVAPNSWHFGKDGHSVFYRFMLQYIIDNKFI